MIIIINVIELSLFRLTFPIKVCELPRETKLCLTLHGYPVGRDTSKPEKNVAKELAWTNVALFDHNGYAFTCRYRVGLWHRYVTIIHTGN